MVLMVILLVVSASLVIYATVDGIVSAKKMDQAGVVLDAVVNLMRQR